MPIRGSFKNFFAASKYPFAKRFGLLSNPDIIDHDMDNNSYMSWATADGTDSIVGMRVDSGNRLQVGSSVYRSTPKVVKFVMNANADIATQCVFIADQDYEFSTVQEVHSTAAGSATATLDITKEASGIAPGAGTSLLSSVLLLNTTANSPQGRTRSLNAKTIQIAAGDRISVKFDGTLTSLAGIVVTIVLTPGLNGDSAVFNILANGSLADQCFYTATKNMKIASIYYVHSTAGTNGSAVNLQVTKDTSTNAPGAGTDLLTNNTNAGFDCKGTANVVQTGALSATAANLRLAPGDRLSVDFAGTLTALAGVVVVVNFTPYYETIDVTWSMNANGSLADQCFFYAGRPYKVVGISEVHAVAGNDGSAVNLQVTLDRETDAPGAGSDLISLNANAGFNLKATANTVQVGTFISDGITYMLPGDRLSVDFAGTLTTLAGVQVTVTLQLA
jgi:hypothetical protein